VIEILEVAGDAQRTNRQERRSLIYGFVMSMIILKLIDLTIGLRVTADEEREGLDSSRHGEKIE
jgi:ammonia channel protein AmtB